MVLVCAIVGCVVLLSASQTSLTSNSPNVIQNGQNFAVSLKDSQGRPIVDKEVTVDIISSEGEHNLQYLGTDGNGVASFTIDGVTPGYYTFKCNFKGDWGYKSSTITVSENIKNS